MIKFFRKIRQKLLSEGMTGKYLEYAAGEIILVVIGILIALQINNWNEHRKAVRTSKNYLSEILKDLAEDTINFNYAVDDISKDIKIEKWALNKTDFKPNQIDTLWDSFGGWYYDHHINDRTYQKIQNSGDAKLVGFDSVMTKITNYYTKVKRKLESYVEWDITEVTNGQTYMQNLEGYIEMSNYRMHSLGSGYNNEAFVVIQDSLEQIRKIIDFAKSTRGRNHFRNNYLRHSRGINRFETTKKEAINLIKSINLELKQNEK